MFLSIITLNYKKSHLTIACLNSLQEQFSEEFKKGEIELIIVDNASGSEDASLLKKEAGKYKNVSVIINKENAGFAKGCNLGAASAKGKYLLFLNNDTIVKDDGILKMAKYLEEHSEASILGGQLSNFDGSPQPSVDKFYTPLNALLLLLGIQRFDLRNKRYKAVAQVDWVKGGLFMVRSDIFKKLAGFDENIFMYIEDMEFCYRADLEGYKTYFYPQVAVHHAHQGSSSRSFAIVNIYKNLLYFYKKHRSSGEYMLLKSLLLAKAGLLIGVGRLTGNKYLVDTYREAVRF